MKRNILKACLAGFQKKCPNCQKGHLYYKFLKVNNQCSVCNESLHHHRTDDAPAYFTIFIVGHILVPLVIAFEIYFKPSLLVHSLLWGPLAILCSYWLLPKIKGALIGYQWAIFMHGFDPFYKD